MNGFIFICCFMPLIVLLLIEYNNKKLISQAIRRKKSAKGRIIMRELANKFVGKECLIYTLNSQITGTIKEVSDSGLLIENDNNVEVVNLDYVVRLREYPKNKKGKKKSVVVD